MKPKRFHSKIDSWLVVLLLVAIGGQVVAIAIAIAEDPRAPVIAIGLGSVLLVVVLVGWILKFTYYEVGNDRLKIVTGPFRWNIAIDSITSIEPSRSLLSSPALSLDRLSIRYDNRRVLVSPADKRGFQKALGFEPGS